MSRVNTNQNAAYLPSVQPADITLQQPVPTTTPLVEALGPEIIDIVHGFDFSKVTQPASTFKGPIVHQSYNVTSGCQIDLRSMSTHDHLFTGLAPSSVALTREAVSSMDESVKIMMAVCTKLLAAIPAKDHTWHTVRAAMMQNPVTELVEAYMWKPGPLCRKVAAVAWPDFVPRPISMKKVRSFRIGVSGVSGVVLTPSRLRIGWGISQMMYYGRLGSIWTSLRPLQIPSRQLSPPLDIFLAKYMNTENESSMSLFYGTRTLNTHTSRSVGWPA